jgi:hypothetical protein
MEEFACHSYETPFKAPSIQGRRQARPLLPTKHAFSVVINDKDTAIIRNSPFGLIGFDLKAPIGEGFRRFSGPEWSSPQCLCFLGL